MPKGLAKATNYFNRLEAWKDWHRVAETCDADLVETFKPADSAGWRKIDRQRAALEKAQAARQKAEEVTQ